MARSPSASEPDNAGVNNECYILSSDNGGTDFTQHTVYSTATGNSWLVSDLQRVGDNIYVLYTDSNFTAVFPYSNLYIASSANAGTNFVSRLISVPSSNGNHKTGTLQDYHYVPKIAGVGNTVSVIWNGLDGEDVQDVFTRRSTDSGAGFGDALNLTRDVLPDGTPFQSGQETLAAQGNYVYGLFLTTSGKVYFRRSTNGGVRFPGLARIELHLASLGWRFLARRGLVAGAGPRPRGRQRGFGPVCWNSGAYVYSTDGGSTFTAPEQFLPRFSLQASNRPQMAIGADGRPHFVMEADFYYPSNIGGWGDLDIFYRVLSPPPGPAGSNNALSLVSNPTGYRFDNMQVLPSSYLNFTTQMTGEVWVRPYPGGKTTGTTSVTKPIFHKNETNYLSYALQTFDRGGKRQAQVQIQTTNGPFWLNPASGTVGLVPDNAWSHLAFTYDAAGGDNNFKLYMNGQLIAATTATGTLATSDGLFFTGIYGVWDVAELRLWNVARIQAQIAATMKRPLMGNEPGLNAYYTFKNTTKDLTGHGNDGILMYMERYIQQTIFSAGAVPGINLLLLLD